MSFTGRLSPLLRRANNGMHPTRDTLPLIHLNLVGGRVMPGVRWLYDYQLLQRY